MAKKKTTRKKKAGIKTTEQLRKEAIKEIDAQLDGDKKPRAKKPTSAKTAKTPKEKKSRKPSGLDAAAQVLAASGDPMRSKDIVDTMLAKGLWFTKGKTPHATIYAAIIREISQKGKDARFEKVDRGRFQIRTGA